MQQGQQYPITVANAVVQQGFQLMMQPFTNITNQYISKKKKKKFCPGKNERRCQNQQMYQQQHIPMQQTFSMQQQQMFPMPQQQPFPMQQQQPTLI
eukprot:11542629-Ditylum_brightwellii.AAC.2